MRIKITMYVFLFLFISIFLQAQTEVQIKQAKEYIKSTGMSESEVKQAAKSRGYSENQINKVLDKNDNKDIQPKTLKKSSPNQEVKEASSNNFEIQELNNQIENNLKKSSSIKELDIIDSKKLEIIDESEFKLESSAQKSQSDLKYFGYEIFKKDPALFQASSIGAADPNYLIGPGDEIIVMLWGETQFRELLAVDREGFIFIPEVGQVFVNGLNLSLLESKLFKTLSQSYESLNPIDRKATTF